MGDNFCVEFPSDRCVKTCPTMESYFQLMLLMTFINIIIFVLCYDERYLPPVAQVPLIGSGLFLLVIVCWQAGNIIHKAANELDFTSSAQWSAWAVLLCAVNLACVCAFLARLRKRKFGTMFWDDIKSWDKAGLEETGPLLAKSGFNALGE